MSKNLEKIKLLEGKMKQYQAKLVKRSLAYGEVGRTGSRDDTSVLRGIISSIGDEIRDLENEK